MGSGLHRGMLGLVYGWEACASPAMVEGYPVSRLPFNVMSLKFHNHEFQSYHSRNKHYGQVKARMMSLRVAVKPGTREEQGPVED